MDRKPRVLIVDDEAPNRFVLSEMARSLGYEPEVAQDGVGALAMAKLDIDLILLDVSMPGMDGFEVARRIREDPQTAGIPIIQITALAGREDRLRAVEAGANDFIAKPVELTELRVRTASLLKIKEQQDAIRRHRAELEATVEKRTTALRNALDAMAEAQRRTHQAHLDTIQKLALAAEYKDEDTASHIHRMSRYCELLARAAKLPPGQVETVLHASPMHDVGKMGIPDGILLKPGKLDPEEWGVMKQHTTMGGRILRGSDSELLQAGEVIAMTHHEKWNGSGYPAGLAGKDIPVTGRICAVADVFDALTTKRPYKRALPNEEACGILHEGRGEHFDPRIHDLFFENLDEALAIQRAFQDGAPKEPSTEQLR
jgi:putative two-component system response regulator